jgi:hypothetical protein
MPMFYCSLSNADAKVQEPPRDLISDDPEEVQKFIEREDRPNRGVFVNRNKLKLGAVRRAKETIDEVLEIPVDIDAKDIQESPATVEQRLAVFPCPPTRINDSGHGQHAFWVLKEPVSTADAAAMAVLETVHKQLVGVLCGDAKVSHHAALVRAVGSHNTKFGEWLEVRTIKDEGPTYYLEDLADRLADIEHPIFTRKKTNGAAHAATNTAGDDCWSQFSETKEPVDVDARLAAMQHQGPGDAAVHPTELDCMNALLARGMQMADAVTTVLTAVMRLEPRWDRAAEEKKLRALGESFLAAVPEVCDRHGWDEKGNPKSKSRSRIIRPHLFPDLSTLPPRAFLLGTTFLRGSVSALVAPGGVGKSSLATIFAVSLASFRNLLGYQPREKCRVFYWNAEEPQAEIDRRIGAICQHYGIPEDEMRGHLFTSSGFDIDIKLAKLTKGAILFDKDLLDQFLAEIQELKVDVVILDPLVSLHALSENDNVQMDALLKKLGWLANQLDCAILVLHHSRKGQAGQTEMSADDVRGGSAIVGACRHVSTLTRITLEEAYQAQVDPIHRDRFFRIDQVKANYTPREASIWTQFVTVTLPSGEKAGVLAPWAFKNVAGNSTGADAEWARGEVNQNRNYRKSARSDDWFGFKVAERLNLDPDDKNDRRRINSIIKKWLRTGVLAVDPERQDEHRKARTYLMPGPNKPLRDAGANE